MKSRDLVVVLFVSMFLVTPLLAQIETEWNRKIQAIAITPTSGGMHDIHVAWTYGVRDPGTFVEVNLNADLEFSVNGIPVDSIPHDLSFAGDAKCCPDCAGCSATCFVGTTCGCNCGSIIKRTSVAHSLSTGDEVSVSVLHARGGVVETIRDDDMLTAAFTGDSILWHRRIQSVQLVPSEPVRGLPLYDLHVEWISATHGIGDPADLSATLEIFINDVPWLSVPEVRNHDSIGCDDAVPPPAGDCTTTSVCGTGEIGDITGFPLECQTDCLDCSLGGCSFPCWCQCQAVGMSIIPGLSLSTGDRVTIQLAQLGVALPELDGLTGDDTASVTLCSTCGDIDGSGGAVDLNDFATLALCYGFTGPGGDCSQQGFACSDLDGDGVVNLSDFATFALWYGLQSSQSIPDCDP